MNGQWIGIYNGTSDGTILINIDKYDKYFAGIAYICDKNGNVPMLEVVFRTKDKALNFELRTENIRPLNRVTHFADSWENVKKQFPENILIPHYVDVKGWWCDCELKLSWDTDIGTKGTCTLLKSGAGEDSELVANPGICDWATFKKFVSELKPQSQLFRGQNQRKRLRTSYHRTGRADLHRFVYEDVQMLHKRLSAHTSHIFNLDIPDENGAFFNLLQHYGYPTPLLDWTYSPYVAAFFAYRRITNKEAAKATQTEKVRIHVFDQAEWKSDFPQLNQLLWPDLHLSISEFMAIENERMIPQQAVSTVTNIDDIETYIKLRELERNKRYLYAIDLPVSERENVFQDLRRMGITAGSLFPGLDGVCEELKERNFDL
jgi:FRG domain